MGLIARITGIALVALALTMSACGDDDGDPGSTTTEAKSGSASGKGEGKGSGSGNGSGSGKGTDSGGGSGSGNGSGGGDGTSVPATGSVTPEQLVSCLDQAGYKALFISPPPEGEPGSEFNTSGSVRLEVTKNGKKAVVAVFFSSEEDAKALAGSDLGKAGTNALIGSVFLSSTAGDVPELDAYRTCLGA